MSAPVSTQAEPTRDALENDLRKLRKINQVLMDRVERNVDAQGGNAFSLFQTAISLEGRVSERTDQLTRLTQRLMLEISQRRETEKALLLAKAEAEQANLGKTLFLAAAGHDLHQPLNAARLFLGTLANEVSAGRLRELVGRVETALDGVTELIGALLDISKLDSRAWTVTPATFPVAPLLAGLADEFGPQAASCGLALHVVPSRAFVHTDRALLQRALGNLVSNAIRYTKNGHILIGCRRRAGAISVEVWDTGIGIAEATRPHIFEEFRQGAAPPRREEKGFGLGLAIVERIARLLGLEIDVRSRVGHGSCFALRVPGGSADQAVPEPRVALGPILGKEFAGLCVTCIDADPDAREALVTLLGSWGCEPVAAAGPEGALPGVAAEPGLIVSDYYLDGDLRGLDAVEALWQAYGRTIPAIVVCRDRSAGVREAVEARGCAFLAGPIRPARLRAMMGHVLDQSPIG
jgi:signal transduction histidine kinase/CheY-like chemotaxis protein